VVGAASVGLAQTVTLPNQPDSVKFAVLGDFGNGQREQYDVAERMWAAHTAFPFEMVLALGDNMYGRQQPQDFIAKFEQPYARLLAAGVKFYAALGNHDRPENRAYPAYNMTGQRYYTFVRGAVRFVVLDSNMMEPAQLAWADQILSAATEPWKIVYFHHPLYSSGGTHGSDLKLRETLEPLFVKYGVSVVFSGHDHIYERILPQKGIQYFVTGSGGKLRAGDYRKNQPFSARIVDNAQAFLAAEIFDDEMVFNVISRTGRVVDSGVILRRQGS
jgi:3',5'-cyclic AMP phosphodiesterase CpdA